MRITSKGQVTIPVEIRESAGLLPHTEVRFEFDGKTVKIVKATPSPGTGRGIAAIGGLRGKATIGLSTDDIMKLTRNTKGHGN